MPLRVIDIAWGETNSAWASQIIERNGKFYWYYSSQTTGIGVAAADRPEGPYKDSLCHALDINEDSKGEKA